MNLASWLLGLALIVLTIAVHTTGVVMMAFGLERKTRSRVQKYHVDPLRAIPVVIANIGLVAVVLAVLHGLEGMLWASAYRWLGVFGSYADASIYSLGTMATLEIPDLVVPSRYRLIGVLESINGVLLFGISTAFLFAVMQTYFLELFHPRGRGTNDEPAA
ncbi:hypothetical protein [Mycolicibacterium goodii]|uniref:hypothetical protein n=1 Tax=Mycolicibacterium goodii TaxID=134601 RepID=UPI001BDBFB4B|nr:hypothetical protein [Mycolicibacterium goodii]MBU8812536.1 hypothetical protein [Mycolicibacterium goodii]MBU8830150.1 hypothetical protein [Mycolicibacterium goodii]ULN46477.1 hypothetical protein MI170_24765 [Mycolicibacterium goodii]